MPIDRQGHIGPRGRDGSGTGTSGSGLLVGTGAPSSSTGEVGNTYLDKDNGVLYGPKGSDNSWPVAFNFAQAGSSVLSGNGAPSNDDGSNGDVYFDVENGVLYGPKTSGTWGSGLLLLGPQGAQGIQGIQGVQGIQGPAGAIGLTWRGAWSSTTTYAIDDAVAKDGSSFFATAVSTNVDPVANTSGATTAGTAWSVLSRVGQTGAQGIQGIQGVQGVKGDQGDAGATGATGATGNTGSAGQGLTYRNAWSSSTGYAAYDLVTYNGSTYLAVAGSTNVTPGTDTSKWQLVASKGDTGSTGATGSTGSSGSAGVSVTSANINGSGHLILTLSNSSTIDAGVAKGADGATGSTGATGATGQGFNFRGAWAASTVYNAYDVVTYNGSTYEASTTFTSGTTFNPSNWNTWALAGTNGSTGATGATGQGFTYKGTWAASTGYLAYDVITTTAIGGKAQTYAALSSHLSTSSFATDLAASKWQLWAQAGADGAAGSAGSTGSTGATGPAGPSPTYGPLASRPTAATAGDKALYVATDGTSGETLYQVQSGAWVQIAAGASLAGGSSSASAVFALRPTGQNLWYWPTSPQNNAAPPANSIILIEMYVGNAITIDRLAVHVASTVVAGSTVRVGVYQADANGFPATLVVDAGTIATATATTVMAVTTSIALSTPGKYFLALGTGASASNLYSVIPNSGYPFAATNTFVGVVPITKSTATPSGLSGGSLPAFGYYITTGTNYSTTGFPSTIASSTALNPMGSTGSAYTAVPIVAMRVN